MNAHLVLIVALVAALIFQEWSWRDRYRKTIESTKAQKAEVVDLLQASLHDARERQRRAGEARQATEERCEAKLEEAQVRQSALNERYEARVKEVAELEYGHGLAAGGEQIQTYEFRREGKRKVLFFSIEQELFLFVTLYRDKVKHLHGDVSNLELFELPDAIKTAIEAARRTGEIVGGMRQIPKIAA
jgi:hypothetical protein